MPDPATRPPGPRAALRALLLRHAREGLTPTAVPGLVLHRRSAPTAEHQQFFPPALSVVVQGSILASVGGERPRAYDAATAVLTSLDLPTTWRVERASPRRPYLSLLLLVSADDVARVLARGGPPSAGPPSAADATGVLGVGASHAGAPGAGALRGDASGAPTADAAVGPAARAYWRAPLRDAVREPLARLVALLDEPAAVPYLARPRTEEVLYRLLAGPEGARLRAIGAGGGRTAQIARAIALLQRALDRPLTLAELARAAHMSATSLHRHFRALTGFSPGQYHKRLRLSEARRLMLARGLGAAEAAARVAYRSASQFSRDYRRVYGRPPHRDVAAARAGPGP